MRKINQCEEEHGAHTGSPKTSGANGGGNGNTTDAGLRSVTYRPPVHSKSTTCLGSCTERRGSSVSLIKLPNFDNKKFNLKNKMEIM